MYLRSSLNIGLSPPYMWCFYALSLLLIFVSFAGTQTSNFCNFEAVLERRIENIGFHRNVEYNISLTSNCSLSNCKLCLQEFIPSGLYINHDQLEDLERLDKLLASVDGDLDIEAPASVSRPQIVKIIKELDLEGNVFFGNATLPVHIRYHDPQHGGGYRKASIEQPELYLYCTGVPLNLNSGVYLTSCAGNEKEPLPYWKVAFTMKSGSKLTVDVPVGDIDSIGLVFAGTYAVVIGGSIYLAGVIYKM